MGKKFALCLAFLTVFPFSAMASGPGAAADASRPAAITAQASGPAMDAGVAAEPKSSSGLPIPRFVSLNDQKVFVRTGPALRYPIKWIYQRENMPVEVIQEFDTWRKVRDIDGDDGWVHQSLLSGDRSVIVKGEQNLSLRKSAGDTSGVLAYLEPNVVALAEVCDGAWCRITAGGYTGWAERKFLWGVYDSEDFD